jgi:hypothetical protein
MIYVLAGTQLATILAFCFVISWVIEDKNNTNSVLAQMKTVSEERLDRLIIKQAESNISHTQALGNMFEMMSEKAFIEREQLLNRLTHPDIAASQVPSAVKGDVAVEDDEEPEPPTEPEEDTPAEDRIPMKELLVRPQEPVQPMGSMTFEDDEEEYDGVS